MFRSKGGSAAREAGTWSLCCCRSGKGLGGMWRAGSKGTETPAALTVKT